MEVTGIGWVGVRTEQAERTARFFEEVLGLAPADRDVDLWGFRTADGDKVEVFGPSYPGKEHMERGPAVGFVVTDLAAAIEELRRAGVPLLGESDGVTWQHFRGPDGNVYELAAEPTGR